MTKIAAVSCTYHAEDVQWNRDKMAALVEKAAAEGVELISFPEESATGCGTRPMSEMFPPDKRTQVEHAELVPEGPTTQFAIELAKKFDMYISFGIAERDDARWHLTHNCHVLVGPEGYIGKYRKVHLPLAERLYHVPGTDWPVFDTRIGRIGLATCYDIYFPESTRTLALKGADIVLNPSCWPNMSQTENDLEHKSWITLAASRALENTVFVVQASTCNPAEGPDVFEGHAQVYGPNPGQLLARTGFEEGLAIADVDIKKEILDARTHSFGGGDLVRDRRPSTYGTLVASNPYGFFSDGLFEDPELFE